MPASLLGPKAGLVLGRAGRALVSQRTVPLASPARLPWQAYGGAGGQRALTVQRPCTAAVTEIAQDAWVGSAMENGTPVSPFALRQHDVPQEWGTTATLCGRQASSQVEGQALSTFHHPMTYRCSIAPGY